jgi:hypothetical protein
MDANNNRAAVPPVATEGCVTSQLPKGWAPNDVTLRVWARRNASSTWETMIPEFSIAGMGDTLDDAIENALELLDDYLVLCQREGKSFAASDRQLPLRAHARLFAEFTIGRIVGRLGSRGSRRRLDLPLHGVTIAH